MLFFFFPNIKWCRSCLKRFRTLLKHYLCISDSIEGMNIFDVHIICTYVWIYVYIFIYNICLTCSYLSPPLIIKPAFQMTCHTLEKNMDILSCIKAINDKLGHSCWVYHECGITTGMCHPHILVLCSKINQHLKKKRQASVLDFLPKFYGRDKQKEAAIWKLKVVMK